MCGAVQLTVDIIIVLQILNYRTPELKSYDPVEPSET